MVTKETIDKTSPHWFNKTSTNLHHITGTTEIVFDDMEQATFQNTNMTFEIASDGGHDPKSGISTFGWVASMNKQLIAKGRGPVEAHPELAESFRAEGYGLVSAGLFIQNLIENFNIEAQQHQWRVYIDNQSLIQ
jgi:hypothetical protein